MSRVDTYIKAILGALIAGLGSYQTAVMDGGAPTSGEWAAVAIATIAALGLVYAIPNAPSTDPTTSTPDATIVRNPDNTVS